MQIVLSRQHMALLWAGATFSVTAILPLGVMISQFETFGGVPTVIAYAVVAGLCTGTVYWWNAQPVAAKAPATVSPKRTADSLPVHQQSASPSKPVLAQPAPPKAKQAAAPKPMKIKPDPIPPGPAKAVRLKPGEQPTIDAERVARALRQTSRAAPAE